MYTPQNVPAVAGLRFMPPKKSGHSNYLAAVKSPHHKIVMGRTRAQALPDCLQGHSFVLNGRLGEGFRLELQGFESKAPVRLGIFFGESADVHG